MARCSSSSAAGKRPKRAAMRSSMLATSRGQSIRVPVDGISFRSRSAGGVKVFNTGAGEEVVSVARIAEQGDEDGNGNGSDEAPGEEN